MIDTHCHLTHSRLAADTPEVVRAARDAGVTACITIGTGVDDARHAAEIASRFPGFVHSAAGIDPFTSNRLGEAFDDELEILENLLREGEWVALGEVGLDYHYDLDPRPLQIQRFERQLDLARRLDLPVVIHVREAHQDMADVLSSHPDNRGVIHSFTGGPAEAERYLELGWHLAFNGVVTFRNAPEVAQAAARTPADRLLFETDAPYLAPMPLRGRRCEPAYVAHTLAHVASLRGEALEEVQARSTANAVRLFRLSVR